MFEIFKMMGTIAINKDEFLRDLQVIKQGVEKTSTEMGRSFAKFTTDHSAQFKKMGMIATAAGAVIGLVVKKLDSSFDAYESALVDMGKITDESFESIEDRMKELPPILGNLTELTRGYYQIVSAGIKDPVEAVNTLTVSAQTAAAAHINQSEVVKGLTKVMAGYEGQIENVSEAADLMFAIEKEGQTTVAELVPIIGSLAKMASDLNVHQNEMGASMAVITKTAGSTAEASTRLEGVFTGLMKPTEKMSDLIESWGFATTELAIKELGFVEVLRKIEEATGGSSEAMGDLFGRKEAILGISALTAEEMGVLSKSIDSVAEKTGMASKAYEDWTKTGEALNKESKAVTENLMILLGQALQPMLDELQKRYIEIITNTGKWVEANAPLAATLAQIAGGLGFVLIPFGALMMMMPGLVIALPKIAGFFKLIADHVWLFSASLNLTVPQLMLVVGAIALVTKATIGWIDALKESKRIKEAEIDSTEAQTKANEKLANAYNMTVEEGEYWIEHHKLAPSVLERVKEKTDALAESERELAEQSRELAEASKSTVKTFEDLDAAILNSIVKGKELSEGQEEYMTVRKRMSDLDKTITQIKIDDLDRECIALLANMETNLMTMEQIDEYRQVMRQSIINESSEREEYLRMMEETQNKLLEMTKTQTELEIRSLEMRNMARIDAAKNAMLSASEEEEALKKIKELYEREKESILELAITRSEKEIAGLNESIELRKKSGEAIRDLIIKRNEEVENLKKLKKGYDETAESLKKLTAVPSKPLYKKVSPEGKVLGIQSQDVLSQAETAAGVTLVPMSKGGIIPNIFNVIKRLAGGGSTDTVPIWATPGEYLIKKQMVDFIKRTGMVTGGLVEAIQKGLPTPSPQFAGGGIVSNWGISRGVPIISEAVPGKKVSSWIYSPNVNVLVQGDGDPTLIKNAVKEALVESADAFDFSGFEIGG